jgi:hypothetical protein
MPASGEEARVSSLEAEVFDTLFGIVKFYKKYMQMTANNC